MVNVLGCERSEPGFESRRPESDFTSTHQKNGGKISSTPAATSTQPLVTNYFGRGPSKYDYHARPIYNYHAYHLKLVTPTWSIAKLRWDRDSTTENFHHRESRPVTSWILSLRRIRNGTSFNKTRPLDSRMQVTEYKTMIDQARSDVAIAKFHGHRHQHVILKNGTEAYDRTRNAPHCTDRYPPPHWRLRATSARIGQQSADALLH